MKQPTVLVNGVAGGLGDPMIAVSDMGFLHGDTLFTTMAVHEGRVVFWKEHLDRLEESARALGYPSFPERALLEREARLVLSLQAKAPPILRLTLSRGMAENPGIDGRSISLTRVFIPVSRPPRPASFHERGAVAECFVLPWNPAEDPRFRHKIGNLLWVKMIRSLRKGEDSFESLLVNGKEEILEGTISSVFAVDNRGVIRTAPVSSGVLPGIMRAKVLAWARETGRVAIEQPVTVAEIFSCREIFLSSSTLPVLPVRSVHSPAGTAGFPGPFDTASAFLEDYRKKLSGGNY